MKRALIVLIGIVAIAGGVLFRFQKERGEALPDFELPAPISAPAKEDYTMLFVGDMMFDREVKAQILREQDPLYPFMRIADTLRSADIAFGNLEGPISDRGTNQGSKYSFRFEPVGTVHALSFAGFDVVSIANNHIWDWGRQALTDTVQHLNPAGIGHVGAGRNEAEANAPFIAQLNTTRIAFLGYTTLYPRSLEAGEDYPGVSAYRASSTAQQISELKGSGADIIVVSFHWGDEYATSSNQTQQEIARGLIDAGADLVIGHHPHVVQEVEKYKDGWIIYSLGNFVFDQFFSPETMSGFMAQARIADDRVKTVEQIPIKLTPTFQPYVVGAPGDPALEMVQ